MLGMIMQHGDDEVDVAKGSDSSKAFTTARSDGSESSVGACPMPSLTVSMIRFQKTFRKELFRRRKLAHVFWASISKMWTLIR